MKRPAGRRTPARVATAAAVILIAGGQAAAPAAALTAPTPEAGTRARVEAYLNQVRDDPGRLSEFLTELPKGGDLHTHLSGAVSTADLLKLAIADGLCLNDQYVAAAPPCGPGQRPATDARTDPAFRDRIIRAWSMKGFAEDGQSGHDHFFATFGKFGPASWHTPEMLAAIASQAAAEHIFYLEPLISHQGDAIRALAAQLTWTDDLAEMRARVTGRPEFERIVAAAGAESDADLARMRELLRCGTPAADPGCRVTIRIDHQVGRIGDPALVFTNLLVGFALAERDRDVVGVNLVQPEDDPKAISEYSRQMRMIGYLRRVYRAAHVTLHAGELTSRWADRDALRSHIRQAVLVAGAERIGHGVDIAGEDLSGDTLRTMARRHVLVEINLTSNCQILRVCGAAHPFPRYVRAGVPVTLSTDDQGVEHTDLTHEYIRAVRTFHLSYAALKTLARASLEHAFVQGADLWRAPDDHHPVAACATGPLGAAHPAPACAAFLRTSPKAALQWRQEAAFRAFERRFGRTGGVAAR